MPYPYCNAFLGGSPRLICKKDPLLSLFYGPCLGTHSPALAKKEVSVLLRGHMPRSLFSAHLCTSLFPPQTYSDKARCGLRSQSSPRGEDWDGSVFLGEEVDKS